MSGACILLVDVEYGSLPKCLLSTQQDGPRRHALGRGVGSEPSRQWVSKDGAGKPNWCSLFWALHIHTAKLHDRTHGPMSHAVQHESRSRETIAHPLHTTVPPAL
jgi:hypothetical protein